MTWRRGRRLAPMAVVVAGWLALAVLTTGRPGPHELRETAARAAQGALDAVRTAHLAGQAEQDGRVLHRYLSPVLDNSRQGVGTALRRVAEQAPPGEAERRLRDDLLALLQEAARHTADLTAAIERRDDEAVRRAVRALGPIGDRLAAFVQRFPE